MTDEHHPYQALAKQFDHQTVNHRAKQYVNCMAHAKGIENFWRHLKRKPMFIGKLTNELVYKNMPKGMFVLDKLKEKTPKKEAGNFRYRLHQSLIPDICRDALKKVIYSVETLASLSESKAKFLKLMKDKCHPQKELPFPELDNLAKNENKKEPIPLSTFNKNLKGLLNVPLPKKDK